jgi:hypothetical protein
MARMPGKRKVKLSRLVEPTSGGAEEPVTAPDRSGDRSAWVRELRSLQKTYSKGKAKISVEEILAESRQDRV